MLTWLILGCLSFAPEGPAALVEQLGSPRYAQRQEATEALEKLGREALPALRSGRESKDPEVRQRVVALIEKIENALMVHPTMVALDFRDRPLPEVVRELSARSGMPMALVPENNAIWQTRRVSLVEGRPVPFWTALDQLCRAGGLSHTIAFQNPGQGGRGSVVQLHHGGAARSAPAPTSDNGPFRVVIQGIHYQRDLRFGQGGAMFMPNGPIVGGQGGGFGIPAGASRGVSEQFYIDMQVMAEPRMAVSQTGLLKIAEATDDQDRSLLIPTAPNGRIQNSGYYGFSNGMMSVQLQAHLKYPEKPGKSIRKLKGALPVTVSARKDEPLVVTLAGAKGETFRNDDVALTVQDVKTEAQFNRTVIEMTIRPLTTPSNTAGLNPGPAGAFIFAGTNSPQNQIEIVDAQDRPYQQWFPSQTHGDDQETRVTLMLMPSENVGPPAKLRYFEMSKAQTEIPFEFTDVPMP